MTAKDLETASSIVLILTAIMTLGSIVTVLVVANTVTVEQDANFYYIDGDRYATEVTIRYGDWNLE